MHAGLVQSGRQRSAKYHLRFARIGAANLADSEILFAATFQFRFEARVMLERYDEDHAHAHVERTQEFVTLELAERGELGKNRRHRP